MNDNELTEKELETLHEEWEKRRMIKHIDDLLRIQNLITYSVHIVAESK